MDILSLDIPSHRYSSHTTSANCLNYDVHNRIDQESPYDRAISNYQKEDTSQAPDSGSSCMQSDTLLSDLRPIHDNQDHDDHYIITIRGKDLEYYQLISMISTCQILIRYSNIRAMLLLLLFFLLLRLRKSLRSMVMRYAKNRNQRNQLEIGIFFTCAKILSSILFCTNNEINSRILQNHRCSLSLKVDHDHDPK